MKRFLDSRKGLLVFALFCTGVCLLYGVTAAQKGLYEALRYPSPMANVIVFGASATLAVITWYRCLRWRPDREAFHRKKSVPLWTGMTVLCLLLAGVWLVLYWRMGQSAAVLAVCGLSLVCAVVSAVRAVKSGKK